jgi:predicted AlkP superfamily pyrophosphatase or phosphodiesterase
LGKTFPHPLLAKSDAVFLSAFRNTPFLDELTATFARELVAKEKIGEGAATDYLAISFSATDYVGHAYGPNSMEAEDNLLRLDATLAQLLSAIEERVGLSHTVIVLSADHGVDDIPEQRRALGFAADRFRPEPLRAQMNAALRQRLGVAEDLVQAFVPPGFYLDATKLAALRLNPETVEAALAEELRRVPGVAHALTRSDLLTGRIARTALLEKVQRAFHPRRSGDVVIVQEQFWYLYPDADSYAAMHGSPYSYDTFVPVIFCAPGVPPCTVQTPAAPGDIPATLAAILGIAAPSGCVGNVLTNVARAPR